MDQLNLESKAIEWYFTWIHWSPKLNRLTGTRALSWLRTEHSQKFIPSHRRRAATLRMHSANLSTIWESLILWFAILRESKPVIILTWWNTCGECTYTICWWRRVAKRRKTTAPEPRFMKQKENGKHEYATTKSLLDSRTIVVWKTQRDSLFWLTELTSNQAQEDNGTDGRHLLMAYLWFLWSGPAFGQTRNGYAYNWWSGARRTMAWYCPLCWQRYDWLMSRATVLLSMHRVTLYHVDSVRTTTVH